MSTIPKEEVKKLFNKYYDYIRETDDAEQRGEYKSIFADEIIKLFATDGEKLEKGWVCECKKEKGFTMVAGYSYCNNCGKRY
jgi:hypothetical protein